MKKHWPYFVAAFLAPLVAILWWWGLFSSVKIEISELGNYHYAYLEAEGPYSKLSSKQDAARALLLQQKIAVGSQVTLIQSDPRTTPHDQLRARTGFIIEQGETPAAPLQVDTIPLRKVVVAEIKAHPILAYGKAYSALLDYAARHQTSLHLPTLELVKSSVLHVEMPLTGESLP